MKLSNVYKEVAKELNLPEDLVARTYRSYWLFVRTKIQALPLKTDLTEEEFKQLRTCFNIPSLGKLSCTYERFNKIKQINAWIKQLRNEYKENKTAIQ